MLSASWKFGWLIPIGILTVMSFPSGVFKFVLIEPIISKATSPAVLRAGAHHYCRGPRLGSMGRFCYRGGWYAGR